MPRRVVRYLADWVHERRHRWYLRMFGARVTELHLWSLNRRSITAAFGAGVAIAFMPLPMHMALAVLVAIVWRLNLPVILASTWVINPLTVVPVYYAAYRLGAWLLQEPPRPFAFELSWRWLESGLGPRWEAFLLGCLVFSVLGGVLGRVMLELIWRIAVMKKYRLRRARRATR